MYDRQPTYPGRVTLMPVSGQENTYDMEMADQPTNPGTPPTTENLLQNATGALFGLDASGTVNQALAVLGKYNQYWWRRRTKGIKYSYSISSSDSGGNSWFPFIDEVFNYSTSITSGPEGISLVNPTTVTVSTSQANTYIGTFANKFFTCKTRSGLYKFGSTITVYTDSGYYNYSPYYSVTQTQIQEDGEWEYIQSNERNTYPDSGEQDGYEYQYLGVPFENAINPAKIETGTYKGAGLYGTSNPNSLTFSSPPKLVIVACTTYQTASSGSFVSEWFFWSPGISWINMGFSGQSGYIQISSDSNTLSWYSQQGTLWQLNQSAKTYSYAAVLV